MAVEPRLRSALAVTQQPVYNLLGGPCRSRIRVYANGWSYKMQLPEDYARGAEAVLKRGFTALKFDPIPGPWRTYIPKDHIRRAVKVTRAVRDAVSRFDPAREIETD
jgi:galactonate dehydratase